MSFATYRLPPPRDRRRVPFADVRGGVETAHGRMPLFCFDSAMTILEFADGSVIGISTPRASLGIMAGPVINLP
jgi:hypothetical protein